MSTIRKKIGFISLGCAKALTDSEQIMSWLRETGSSFTDKLQEADLVIINTCSFIEDAIAESMQTIAEATENNANVIVMGCLAATQTEKLKEKFPELLAVINSQDLTKVVDILRNFIPKKNAKLELDSTKRIQLTPPHYAYLKISEGCNNKCSFCLIPTIKGSLVSIPLEKILTEATELVKNGVKELILVAQDTFIYENDATGKKIVELLEALSKLDVWIRLHYIYPYKNVTKLIKLMSEKKILPYLDMPLQHISKSVLKKMNRPGDYDSQLEKIQQWKKLCPELKIRTSFIVGFPGETQDDFNELMDFLEEAKLDRVAVFKYSDVEGIPSNEFDDKIDEQIIDDRFHTAMQRQQDISTKILQSRIGNIEDIIIDDYDKKSKLAIGRSMGDSPDVDGVVYVKGLKASDIGTIVKATITKALEYDLEANVKKVIC